MTPEFLIANFERLAEAPEGIPQLKRLISTLAVRGELSRTRSGRSSKEQVHFRPLAEVAEILDNQRIPINSDEREARIAGKTRDELYPYYGATQQVGWIDGYIFEEELVLLGEDGVPFLDPLRPKAYIVSGKTWVNNHAHVLKGTLVSNKFLCLVLNITSYEGRITGTTRAKLNQSRMKDIPVPVLSLEDQEEATSLADELMAKCDELEKRQEAARDTRIRVHKASLNSLVEATTPDELSTAWQRLSDNFDSLHETPERIEHLNQSILELGIRGRLSKLDQTAGKSSEWLPELVESVRQSRDELGIKRKPKTDDIDLSKVPFVVPDSWAWVRLGTICIQVTDGAHHTPTYTPTGIPFLSVKDVSSGTINFENCRYISEDQHQALIARCNPQLGDMLLTKVGTTGIAKLIDIDREFSIFVSLALLKFPNEFLDGEFFELALNSPALKKQSAEFTQGVGNKNLVLRHISNFLFPLPPISDQRKIVQAVRGLMDTSNGLKTDLSSAQVLRTRLSSATVHALAAA